MTAPDLDALEKLADEATPGEWTTLAGSTPYPECDDADSWVAILSPAGKGILTFQERYRMGKDDDRADYDRDAAFIAAANPATIKALISELKEARGLLKLFAAMAEAGDQRPKDDAVWAGQDGKALKYGDFRSARAFLARNGGSQ